MNLMIGLKVCLICTLILSSCISSNKLFNMDGDSGTKENLPVHVEVLVEMAEYCENVYDEGHEIHYWTARGCYSGDDHTELTKKQFEEWGVKYHHLHCNEGKPHFDMYICDKSYNCESFFHYRKRGLP